MRREYTEIVYFCKCLYGDYNVLVYDFVFSLIVDAQLVTRMILDF